MKPRSPYVAQLAEPGLFWVRYVPRGWQAADVDGPWLDLASARLAGLGRRPDAEPELPGVPMDDVVYVPPVGSHHGAARDRALDRMLTAGTPVIVQLRPGQTFDLEAAVAVWDLTAALLDGWLDPLDSLPAGSIAVWPLLPGLTDDAALWEAGLRRLAAARVETVQAVAVDLGPADRRRLADGRDDAVFDALFHGRRPDERAFARAAAGHGLRPFVPRPLPRPPLLGAGNRRAAGHLAMAGELWLRLGRTVARGHALYRAARWVDGCPHDVNGLSREGNLGIVPWLSEEARRVIAEQVECGRSAWVEDLIAEYVGEAVGESVGGSSGGGTVGAEV